MGRKCLILDLDETLVHSSFKVRFLCSPIILGFLIPFASQYNKPTMLSPWKLNIIGTMSM